MPSCIVQGCTYSWKKKDPDVIIHTFPRELESIKKWLLQTRQDFGDIEEFSRKILVGTRGAYRVCSRHFTADSYETKGLMMWLKKDAVPTIFPDIPENLARRNRAKLGVGYEPGVRHERGLGYEPGIGQEHGAGNERGIGHEPGVGHVGGVRHEPGVGYEPGVRPEPGVGHDPGVGYEPGASAWRTTPMAAISPHDFISPLAGGEMYVQGRCTLTAGGPLDFHQDRSHSLYSELGNTGQNATKPNGPRPSERTGLYSGRIHQSTNTEPFLGTSNKKVQADRRKRHNSIGIQCNPEDLPASRHERERRPLRTSLRNFDVLIWADPFGKTPPTGLRAPDLV